MSTAALRLSSCSQRLARAARPAALARWVIPAHLPKRSSLLAQHRTLSTTPTPKSASAGASIAQYVVGPLDERTYHDVSDHTMDKLTEQLEELVEEAGDEAGYEIEYSSGVLTLSLGDQGTYVLNKQPPNKQIWLSSPISGPKRYDYDPKHKVWFYSRDGQLLRTLLSEELAPALGGGKPLEIDLGEGDELD